MKNIFILSAIVGMLTIVACQKEYEVKEMAETSFAGQWLVHHNVEGIDLFGAGYLTVETYNTSSVNGSEIWVNDESFWPYRAKCTVNLADLTFSSDTVISAEGSEIKVVIRNGKILKDAGTSLSGRTVDSIYYEVWMEDWPSAIDYYGLPYSHDTYFQVGGVAYTGFAEDTPN